MNKFSKDQCKHKDWKNKKEILAEDLAYCIYIHGLSIDDVPKERKELVQKEIDKLVKVKEKEKKKKKEKERIESILFIDKLDEDICKLLDIDFKNDSNESSYLFDPELFFNAESASEAIVLVEVLSSRIMNKIMVDGVRFKDGKFYKDIQSAKTARLRLIETYEKIGISKSKTIDALKSIEWELPTTVKKELIDERENLIKHFIALGNKKTNAVKIAAAITLLAEQNIYTTSKF